VTNLFISYRRDDAGGHAGRLSDRLIARFGGTRIFMDVQDIQPGQNFQQAIERTLASCDHVLAVIGPRWLEILQARQSHGEDFVRHEVTAALARGATVIPVLVGGAKMPGLDQLPPELAGFARCQAVEIRDNRFDEDSARLVDFLAGGAGEHEPSVLGLRRPRRVLATALACIVLAALGTFAWLRFSRPPQNLTQSSTPADPAIDGNWVADLQKPGQPAYRIRLTLSRAGEEVIGTVSYPTGEGAILDGRYANGRLTFHTSHIPQFESQPATIRFQALVEGDVIRLTSADDAGVATGVAHRASSASARPMPSLSYGTWTLRNARDEEGKNWNNSVLQFTEQQETPDGLSLRGRFTWRLDNVLMGTEDVSGRYVDRTRQIILEGTAISDADHPGVPERLAVGSYSAVLAADERTLASGRWGSTAGSDPGFAGEWEAVR